MWISKKQRATINSAVKPFNITSNYLGPGLQKLIEYYSKFFAKHRYSIAHFLPAYKSSSKNSHILTVVFNTFLRKGGFAKKRRPITWKFYGNVLLTKYGKKKQQKEEKKKHKNVHLHKSSGETQYKAIETTKIQNEDDIAVENSHLEHSNQIDSKNLEEASTNVDVDIHMPKTSDTTYTSSKTIILGKSVEKLGVDDESVDNIWNLDIQKVAALITESGTDDKFSEGEAFESPSQYPSLSLKCILCCIVLDSTKLTAATDIGSNCTENMQTDEGTQEPLSKSTGDTRATVYIHLIEIVRKIGNNAFRTHFSKIK